jgi:hypothetical protein
MYESYSIYYYVDVVVSAASVFLRSAQRQGKRKKIPNYTYEYAYLSTTK